MEKKNGNNGKIVNVGSDSLSEILIRDAVKDSLEGRTYTGSVRHREVLDYLKTHSRFSQPPEMIEARELERMLRNGEELPPLTAEKTPLPVVEEPPESALDEPVSEVRVRRAMMSAPRPRHASPELAHPLPEHVAPDHALADLDNQISRLLKGFRKSRTKNNGGHNR